MGLVHNALPIFPSTPIPPETETTTLSTQPSSHRCFLRDQSETETLDLFKLNVDLIFVDIFFVEGGADYPGVGVNTLRCKSRCPLIQVP